MVQDIFKMCMEGKGNETIAHILSDRKVMTPTACWRERGINRDGKKAHPDPYKWKCSTVGKILSNQEYCGDIINFKTCSESFKNKARLENAKDNWAIFKDIHEPIIERSVFERVQEIKAKTKRRAPKAERNRRNAVRKRRIYLSDPQIHADGYADCTASSGVDRPY